MNAVKEDGSKHSTIDQNLLLISTISQDITAIDIIASSHII